MARKILIVDDEPNIVRIIESRLKASGYDCISAYDGLEALDKTHQERPDLIILDLMLPKLDGYKVCRMLKFDEKYKKIPILIFTARAQESDKKTADEVGADAYLVKPFEPQALLDTINDLLKDRP